MVEERLTFSGVWDYGRDIIRFYNLQSLHFTTLLAVDAAEENYLEEALLRISK
jgi:hypothetical protein